MSSHLQARGILAIVCCAFLWSLGGLFIKLIDWNPFLIAGMRSLIASFTILAFVRTVRIRWSGSLVAAALANALTMLLFVAANKYTTAANAILIQYLAPVFTAVFSFLFLKEKLHKEQVLALVLTLGGMAVLFSDKVAPGQMLGNLLALGAGITFALMFIFTRKQKDGEPLQSLMVSHWVTAFSGLSLALFFPLPTTVSPVALGAIAGLGVVQIGLAAVFFAYGIKRVNAVTANLISVIEPVFNPLWVFLVVGEAPTALTLAGGVLILAGVVAATLGAAGRSRKQSAK